MQNSVEGRFWLSKEDKNFLGKGRIELLQAIEDTGSITKAAKSMKMSYKAAWDAVDAMSNLAEVPLVTRLTGGKGGGGSKLTPYAAELIRSYQILAEEHQRFMDNLTLRINEKGQLKFLESMTMRVSARNQLLGNVIKIHKGAVNAEVVLQLKGGDTVTAIVTNDSIKRLELGIDTQVYALFKAGSVILSLDKALKISTKNRFEGVIERIERGSVNSEVILRLPGGSMICSNVTNEAVEVLELKEGLDVVAFCKATSIILGLF